jgi:hypothetical protein
MGALFSAGVAVAAIILGRAFGVSKSSEAVTPDADPASGKHLPEFDKSPRRQNPDAYPGALPGGASSAFAQLEDEVEENRDQPQA